MGLKRSLKIYFPVIVIYLFIYLLLQLVFIGQREPIHLRRSRRRLHAGDSLTNIFLSSASQRARKRTAARKEGGRERKERKEGQRDHSVVWEKLPSSVIQRCTAA